MRALLLAALLLPSAAAAKGLGTVVSTTGKLTAKGKTLRAGDAIPAGAVDLESGTATLAIDGGRLLLTGPARVAMHAAEVRLDAGSLLLALKKKFRRYMVRTPVAVAAVRGTEFFVEVVDSSTVDVCICHGALDVTGNGMEKTAMVSADHEGMRFTKDKDGKVSGSLAKAGGHTETQLESLRAALNGSPKP